PIRRKGAVTKIRVGQRSPKDLFAGGNVQLVDQSVKIAYISERHGRLAIRRESNLKNLVFNPLLQLGRTADIEPPLFSPRYQFVQTNRPIVAAGKNRAAIGGKVETENAPFVAIPGSLLFAGRGVPDANSFLPGARDEPLPIRGEGQRTNDVLMPWVSETRL